MSSQPRRPPTAVSWLLWGLIAVFAALMVPRSAVGWDVVAAGWWTLLLLVSTLGWCVTRARGRRGR